MHLVFDFWCSHFSVCMQDLLANFFLLGVNHYTSILARDLLTETNLMKAVRNVQVCSSECYTQIEDHGEGMGKQAFRQVKIGKEKKILALEDL